MILNLDCRHGLAMLPDNSVDAIVCDPMYGLGKEPDALAMLQAWMNGKDYVHKSKSGFMGKEWDAFVPQPSMWRECWRVLKPGGYLLAFAGTRTQHLMALGLQISGFEIRDMIAWVYGSGYPKHRSSLKPALEPITMARKPAKVATLLNIDACRVEGRERTEYGLSNATRTAGNTYGTPSPAADFDSTVGRYPANLIHDGSDEVLAYFPDSAGSGGSVPNVKISGYGDGAVGTGSAEYLGGERTKVDCGTGSAARFFMKCKSSYTNDLCADLNLPPESANIAEPNLSQQRNHVGSVLAHAVNEALPAGLHCSALCLEPSTNATGSELKTLCDVAIETILNINERFWQDSKPVRLSQSHSLVNSVVLREPTGIMTITVSHWKLNGAADPVTFNITPKNLEVGAKDLKPSTGSIIYCAKASKRDRNEGLEAFDAVMANFAAGTGLSKNGDGSPRNMNADAKNPHPTVKPTELMRYLCRLVTPPGGLIVDPFAGSGSTGKAAILEGFQFVGFELDPQYAAIANARIDAARNSCQR